MSLDPNKKLTLPPKRPSAQRPDVVQPPSLNVTVERKRLIVTGYGECGKREREYGGTSGDTRWLDGSRDASFGLRRVEIGIVGDLVVSRVAATMVLPKGLL